MKAVGPGQVSKAEEPMDPVRSRPEVSPGSIPAEAQPELWRQKGFSAKAFPFDTGLRPDFLRDDALSLPPEKPGPRAPPEAPHPVGSLRPLEGRKGPSGKVAGAHCEKNHIYLTCGRFL